MLPQLIGLDNTMAPRKPHQAQPQDMQFLPQTLNHREYMTLVPSTRQLMPSKPQDMVLKPRDIPYRTITILPERILGLNVPAQVFQLPSKGQFQGQGPFNIPQQLQRINSRQIPGTLLTIPPNLGHKSHPRNILHSNHQIPSMVVVRTITSNLFLALSLANENYLTV